MADTRDMHGRVALVTGAASGMGLATARLFAARGASVMLADVNGDAGRQAAGGIVSAGGAARFYQADLAHEDQIAALVAATVKSLGRIDYAINNAALPPDRSPIADADLVEFDRIVSVNLRAVLGCMKYEIRAMFAGNGGAIVNVGSVNSMRPQSGSAAYTAAKHGVIGLTRTASLEYARQGIRVNAVLPGGIETPMLEQALAITGRTAEQMGERLSAIGRLGKPEEVAEASLWLCSDAASFITGHALAVDGGYLSL